MIQKAGSEPIGLMVAPKVGSLLMRRAKHRGSRIGQVEQGHDLVVVRSRYIYFETGQTVYTLGRGTESYTRQIHLARR